MNTTISEIAWVTIGTLFTFTIHMGALKLGPTYFAIAAPFVALLGSVGMMIIQSRSVVGGSFAITRHWIIPAGIGVGGTISFIYTPILGISAYITGIENGSIIIAANYLGALIGTALSKT